MMSSPSFKRLEAIWAEVKCVKKEVIISLSTSRHLSATLVRCVDRDLLASRLRQGDAGTPMELSNQHSSIVSSSMSASSCVSSEE